MALTPAAKKMRKLGISLTDPDLTDASSDESHDGSAQKQAAREIEFSDPAPEAIAIEKTMKKKQVNRRGDPSSCGAYRRPSGRWSSEITSGNLRMYLGTFDTMEEARRAYLSKKIEIEATKLSGFGGGDGGRGVESTGDSVVEESAKKKGKSQKPLFKQWGEWSTEIRDPIEKSEICSGSERNGDSVVEGSPKGKRKSQRPYPGVFKRWGKWAAEVRDPFKKSKKWLGHYGSPEEARAAIIAKKLEFDARRLNIEKGESVASPCSVQAFGSVGTSGSGDRERIGSGNWEVQGSGSLDSSGRRGGESWELAVLKRFTEGRDLDLMYVMQIASHIIDINGNFVGEFSSLDDLQIRNAE